MNRWRIVAGVVGLAVMWDPGGMAQEAKPWKANLELSNLQTEGNTDSTSLLFGGRGERTLTAAKLSGEFLAMYGEKAGAASDRNWFGALKYDRYVTERLFAYLAERVDRNVLNGIEIRYATQAGVGYDVIKTPSDLLKAEAGFGYVRENPISPFTTWATSTRGRSACTNTRSRKKPASPEASNTFRASKNARSIS